MSSPSVVRLATAADSQELWRLTLQAHNENALRSLAPERIAWWMDRVLFPDKIDPWDMGPRGVIGVIGPPGALEGIVFILIGQFWYSNEKHLEELIIFTDPKHRKSNHTQAMIRWMKSQVDNTGLPLLTGVMVGGQKPTEELNHRRGSHHRRQVEALAHLQSVFGTDRTASKIALYTRMLGKPIGAFFFVTPKGSALPPALALASS